MRENKRRILLLIFSFMFMIVLIFGTLYVWNSETRDMEQQELLSQQMADEYLLSLTERNFETPEDDEDVLPIIPENEELDYEDNRLFGYHTEDEAVGKLDCILEIPAIEFRQSIYTGTPSQIRSNLSKWMAVTCRADYVLGSTAYCIYLHNPTNKSIRISYAQETLVPGDYLIITQENTVYLYEMTNMFPEWREICTSKYADNKALDSSLLYIFTCARGEWQGRNLVIEGKLYNTYELSDWQQNQDMYIAEYKGQYKPIQTITKESLKLNITNEEEKIKVSLTRPDNCQALHCSIGLFDNEGYLIDEAYPYDGYPMLLDLPLGEYIIGVYKNETEYESPMPYQVILNKRAQTNVQTIDEREEQVESTNNTMKYLALAITGIFSCMWVLLLIRTIVDMKK